MSINIHANRYTPAEEWANSISHGIGIVLSIAGLAVLASFASLLGTTWHIVSCSIYGATQIMLYATSTLYHSIPIERVKKLLRTLDHSAIFLLIAGTYTPFLLVNLRGPWGWSLLAVVWALAIAGIALQGVMLKLPRWVNAIPYIGMSWLVVVAIRPMLESVAPGGLWLLAAGGLAYMVGVIFYVWKKLPFNHAIWHGFVLLGSALHYFSILFYVIPLAQAI
ncbi:MAG: hemolysin III family protein [Anaerolineales bacterium]|nr:hemolysin III family protein [Anaerolineales bacterium]